MTYHMELFRTQTVVKVQLTCVNIMPVKPTELFSVVTTVPRANPGLPFSNTVLGHAELKHLCSCSGVNQQQCSEVKGA